MTFTSRRFLLRAGLGVACACAAGAALAEGGPPQTSPTGKWMCPPCGCSADGKDFDKPGACPACGMDLIPKPAPQQPPR